MVDSSLKLTVSWPQDRKLPLEDVLLEGHGHEVRGRVGLHLLDLLKDPLHRRVAPVVLRRGLHLRRLRGREPSRLVAAAAAACRCRLGLRIGESGEGRKERRSGNGGWIKKEEELVLNTIQP